MLILRNRDDLEETLSLLRVGVNADFVLPVSDYFLDKFGIEIFSKDEPDDDIKMLLVSILSVLPAGHVKGNKLFSRLYLMQDVPGNLSSYTIRAIHERENIFLFPGAYKDAYTFSYSIIHETGHSIHKNNEIIDIKKFLKLKRISLREWINFARGFKNNELQIIDRYLRVTDEFADGYAYYFLKREYLRDNDIDLYHYFCKIIEGKGFDRAM